MVGLSSRIYCFLLSFLLVFFLFSCQKEVVYYDDGYYNNPNGNYNRQVPRRYENFRAPASRIYQNPYAPAPRQYYPYYDSDYYYVPPTNYDPYGQDENFFKGGRFDLNNIM
jgi:hypothetical protein